MPKNKNVHAIFEEMERLKELANSKKSNLASRLSRLAEIDLDQLDLNQENSLDETKAVED